MRPGWQRRLLRELAFVVVLGTPLLLFFLIASPRANAVKLLRDLNAVQVNRTHFHQVETLAAGFGSQAACVGDNCLFQFQNLWLHRLHLAPLTEFTVMVERGGAPTDPGGGEVRAIDMAMLVRSAPEGGSVTSALVFDRGDEPGGPPYQASVVIGRDGRPGRTVVLLSPHASARQRARARAFNLRCLTRIGGCATSRDLLPGVWQGARQIESVGLYLRPSTWRAAAATSPARN